jgi:Zn-finger nucleic acid-binding protein
MCPACKKPMVGLEFGGIQVDRCLDCGGTWLDAGELQMLLELAGLDAGELSAALRRAEALGRSGRRCPRCRRRLQTVPIERPEVRVELDRCPRGDGLWLDRGEIEKVVRSFSEGAGGVVARFFSEIYRGELGTQPEGE